MNLYEIDARLMSLIDQETGEVMDYDAYLSLQMAKDQKIENTALHIKNLMSDIKQIKAEESVLKDRRQSKEKQVANWKRYLSQFLDGDKFESPRCSISYHKSTALEVANPSAVAEWLDQHGHFDLVVYAAPTVDKRAVAALIKQGETIPGAEVVERQSLTLR